jgi:two-component system, chemotaxis family, CheB/CheR fusion protein
MKTKRPASVAKRPAKRAGGPAVARVPAATRRKGRLRIIGLGASAGGLEACEQFFTHLPPDTGMAFVVVSHLDPDRKGMMPELLQRQTRLKVSQAEDGMKVLPNRIYVIPPNKDLSILHGRLQLLEPSAPRGLRMPVDFFFKSLAQDQKDRGIGVILSGMGTDGTQGVRAIKEEMGLAVVQDPASAKYDGMPRSAIGTGLVDIAAPAAELPARLVAFVNHAARLRRQIPAEEERPSGALQKMLVLLRARTGTDFSGYKPTTIHRRIERRMTVHQLHTLPHYVRYMQENPQEIDLLFRELLIGVTRFFRDPPAFEALKEKALPRMLDRKAPGGPLRIWVPGCSTGEEAYSVAIAVTECLAERRHKDDSTIQVFATDLDKEAVDKARQGVFPANIAADVSPERLKRFFIREENGYTIKKAIRDRIVFAPHDILTAPPFTKLDLLCCRNLLIYLKAESQRKLLATFRYALNPGGILFLGPAESVGGFTDVYAPIDNRWKLFGRKELPDDVRMVTESAGSRLPREAVPPPRTETKTAAPGSGVATTVQQLLLDSYVPPAVVINRDGDIIYVVGRTGKYLEPSSGKADPNVFAMAREGLRLELGSAIQDAVKRSAAVTVTNLRVKTNGGEQAVNLTVRPLEESPARQDLLLVVFQEVEPAAAGGKGPAKAKSRPTSTRAKALEKELQRTRSQLQSTIEQMGASQEELKAANEELQSNNEELQSTNEELTTTKEELQSLNEEMTTVNSELQTKIDELSLANDDMKNLLNGIEVATVFTDNDLGIKRFTPQATRIINLIPTDVGRPLSHLVTNLKYERLLDDAKTVLATLVAKEAQVETTDGQWYLMRILPYRTADNVIEGVVITFTEITPLKQLEASLRESQSALTESRLLAESIIATVREPLLVLDAEMRIVSANRSFYGTFRMTAEQTEGHMLHEVGNREWDIPQLKRLLHEVLPSQTELKDFRMEHNFPSIGHKVMLLNARQVDRPDQRPPLILLAMEDITNRSPEGRRGEKP